ncbi:ribosomal large subunit pseudouridylate synthase [Plasmodium gonderi]|uniref:Ribosomal large subunit pseudouridylate synthase n=1 Tax=Plasmodium gonderi TaxID=77519 RepID=A0A1Y1JKM5_PLAGO|nr:ribosomal large subunit pseudouridylate synthase [Plasmodium gonderi]GAW81342.1 ribosomal large subunit pseudouridylate synthase [Plasmodium gonderi]
MIFGRFFFSSISKQCKQKSIVLPRKKGRLFSTENKALLKKRKGSMEEKDIVANSQPLYKSYKGHNLKIVYENDFFLVVNKPYDIKLEKGKFDDIYPSVETLLRQKKNLDVFRICGQLDYATSGLLIIAKDKLSCNILNYNIESKNIGKIYLAILYGHLPLGVVHVNTPISKVKNEFKMKLCYNYNDYYDNGKYCYSLIYPYKQCYLNNEKVTLCELRTVTGRRHQLRLHALSLGSAIVGDETYFEDMISIKYKIGCSLCSSSPSAQENDFIEERSVEHFWRDTLQSNSQYEGVNGSRDSKGSEDKCNGLEHRGSRNTPEKPITKIDVERMMLHCWIVLQNNKDKKQKLKKSEDINMLEKKIFDWDYIICQDEISKYVNEEERTYEQCVLKNNDLINTNFINYNAKNINKNIKNIDRKLSKVKYDHSLNNNFVLENLNGLKHPNLLKRENVSPIGKGENEVKKDDSNNKDCLVETQSGTPTKDHNDLNLNPNKVKTIDVTDTFINDQEIDKNSIYLVKNGKYENPNHLFDDIHDNVNKFNWG